MLDGWNGSKDDQPTLDGEVVRPGRIVPRPAPIGMALVGCGYWGPNLARNVSERPEMDLRAICDRDPEQLQGLARRRPEARAVSEFDAVLCDPSIEAVIVATPP